MLLDDLIEEQSIESIAKKTNLAETVIAKLFNRDFKSMTLPQSIGALRIIEREYGVDLNELHHECRDYFEDHSPGESRVVTLGPAKKKKKIFSKLLAAVLLILLAYSAWYFFTGYYKQKTNQLDIQSARSLINTILNSQDTTPKDLSIEKADEEAETKHSEQVSASLAPVSNDVGTDEVVMVEKNISEQPEEEKQVTEALALETSIADKNKSLTSTEENSTMENNHSAEEAPVVVVEKTMVLLPQKMMWFRLTDPGTKEKREFKREDRYEIDMKEHNWLFATENAEFAFIHNDFFEEFGGRGKLFFRLDQKGIHQLSEAEYRAAAQ